MGKLQALVNPEEEKAAASAVGVVVKKLKKLVDKYGEHTGDHEDTHSIITAAATKLKDLVVADQDPDDEAPGEGKGTSADTTVPPEYEASYNQLTRALKQGVTDVGLHHDTVTKMEVAGQAITPANDDDETGGDKPDQSQEQKPKPMGPSTQELTLVLADPNAEKPEVPEQVLTLAVEEPPSVAAPATLAPDTQDGDVVVTVDPEELRRVFREAAQDTFGHLTGNVRSFSGRGRVLPKRQR
jgi:hypothetical protein